MKLIKFHSSFITPCSLPFANLSKSSNLYPTGKKKYIKMHINPKREFWVAQKQERV
jgi:hypothetical protein